MNKYVKLVENTLKENYADDKVYVNKLIRFFADFPELSHEEIKQELDKILDLKYYSPLRAWANDGGERIDQIRSDQLYVLKAFIEGSEINKETMAKELLDNDGKLQDWIGLSDFTTNINNGERLDDSFKTTYKAELEEIITLLNKINPYKK